MKEKIKKGLALLRVSDIRQGLTQFGSLDAQSQRIIRFFEQKNSFVNEKYSISKMIKEEQSAFKGKNEKRVEFNKMIELMRTGAIDFIAIEDLSRLVRDVAIAAEIYWLAVNNNIELWEVVSGINYADKKTPMLYNLFITKAVSSELESINTSMRVSIKQREAMVVHGKDLRPCPILGLDCHATKVGFYVINSDELNQVIDIYEKFIIFKSYSETVDYCNHKGYRTKIYSIKEKINKQGERIAPRKIGGNQFDQQSVRALLTNEKFRGGGTFVDKYDQFPKLQDIQKNVRWQYAHGQLINSSLLKKVDETLSIAGFQKRPRKISSKDYSLLGGLIVDNDGNTYHCHSAKKGSYFYYVNPVTRHRLPMDEFDLKFMDMLESYSTATSAMARVVDDYVDSLKIEIADIGDKVINISSDIENVQKVIDQLSLRRRLLLTDGASESMIDLVTAEIRKSESELQKLVSKKIEISTQKESAMQSYDPHLLKSTLLKAIMKIKDSKGADKRVLIKCLVRKIEVDSVEVARVVFNVTNLVSPSRAKPGGNKFVGTEKWWVKQDLNL